VEPVPRCNGAQARSLTWQSIGGVVGLHVVSQATSGDVSSHRTAYTTIWHAIQKGTLLVIKQLPSVIECAGRVSISDCVSRSSWRTRLPLSTPTDQVRLCVSVAIIIGMILIAEDPEMLHSFTQAHVPPVSIGASIVHRMHVHRALISHNSESMFTPLPNSAV
jgi:hypothetical protein